MIKRYRKKPVVIEAFQWDGSLLEGVKICEWIDGGSGDRASVSLGNMNSIKLSIKTLESTEEGYHMVSPNDYVIKGIKDEFYSCKPDVFTMTYDEEPDQQAKGRSDG